MSSGEAHARGLDHERDALVAVEPGDRRQRPALDLDDRDAQARRVEHELLERMRGAAGRRAAGAPRGGRRTPPRPGGGRRRAPRPRRASARARAARAPTTAARGGGRGPGRAGRERGTPGRSGRSCGRSGRPGPGRAVRPGPAGPAGGPAGRRVDRRGRRRAAAERTRPALRRGRRPAAPAETRAGPGRYAPGGPRPIARRAGAVAAGSRSFAVTLVPGRRAAYGGRPPPATSRRGRSSAGPRRSSSWGRRSSSRGRRSSSHGLGARGPAARRSGAAHGSPGDPPRCGRSPRA